MRHNKKPQQLFKGYFNYYLQGVLKSYNFALKTIEWCVQHQASIIARCGESNYVGINVVFDRMQTEEEVRYGRN